MPVHNSEIAAAFDEVADLLDIRGDNPFRVRAYRAAAETISRWPDSLAAMLANGEDLSRLPTIGKDLAGKIREMVDSGHLVLLDRLEHEMPAELASMLEIRGLGPRRVRQLYEEGGIKSLVQLREAAEAGHIRALAGFGSKSEARILEELDRLEKSRSRWLWAKVEPYAESLSAWLRRQPHVSEATVAGSYRRRRETVGDLDIVVSCPDEYARPLVRSFIAHDDVKTVLASGATRASVIMRYGLQVDIRVVTGAAFGAALLYFTGSRAHNIALRRRSVKKGLKLNEYGLFRGRNKLAGRTEASVYQSFKLPWIPPELREDRGEIDAADKGLLPTLVTREDLRGDLHAHTSESDGRADIEAMASAAMQAGLEYLAISDHSQHARIANGLDANRLQRQLDLIDELNDGFKGFRLLKSSEVDILEDGSLDLDTAILERLDFRVCAIHDNFELSEARQTKRLMRAMDNPLCNIIAHPTTRLIGRRPEAALNMERIIDTAAKTGCHLEINSSPMRLDLDDTYSRMAAERGVLLAISSDAHDTSELDQLRFGIDQARRGWIQAGHVLNTRPWRTLKTLLTR